MAQVIKIKRGGLASLVASTPTLQQGELLLATGSLNGLGATFFVADAANAPELPYAKVESISDGPTLASSLDGNFTGLLIHSASDNKLYRYNGSAFVELPIAAGSFVGTLPVSNGGTNATSFADKAVIISQDSGTDTLSALTLTTSGQLVIGGASGPAAATLTEGTGLTITNGDGSISIATNDGEIDHDSLLNFSADEHFTQANITTVGTVTSGDVSAILPAGTVSGSEQVEDIVGGMLTGNTETLITVTYQDGDGTIDFAVDNNLANYSNASSNFSTVTQLNNSSSILQSEIDSLTAATSSYLQSADLNGYVNKTGTPLNNQIAIFTDADTIEGSANLTFDGTHLAIGGAGEVRFRDSALLIRSSQDGQLDAIADTKLNLQAPGVDIGNVTTTTATTVNIGNSNNSATVNIKGNLNVAGTTTTVNSTTVNIGDRIIELNAGSAAGDGGILVRDTNGSQTGSLLWDTTGNYWKSGLATDGIGGGTLYRIPEFVSTTNITDNTLIVAGANGRLEGSGKFTEDASNGIVADPKFTGLNDGSSADTDRVIFVTSTGVVGQVTATDTTATHNALLGYDGTGLSFSSVIDGGTF